ncbi:TorD/DmsD family molecular chaperone [Thermodesulfovibrio hydrogeniphilus]
MNFLDPLEQEERAEIYRFFGYLFMDVPDIEMIEDFQTLTGITINDTYEEICDDYVNLFTEGQVPNYEEFYRSQKYADIPIDLSLNDVQHFYWTAGVAIDEEFDLAPDHVSMELIFMSYLIEQNLQDLQIEFLKRLCDWIPMFCETLYEKAQTDFYKEVASFLKEFVLSECGVEG